MTKSSYALQPSLKPLQVSVCEPKEEGEWDHFVKSSKWGTFCHLYGWRRVIEKALGRKCFYLLARDENGVTGVFPISLASNVFFGQCLVSLPLAVYGGICADDADSFKQLLSAGSRLGEQMGVQYLEMRNREEAFESSLPSRDLYVTFQLDLSPGPEELMKVLPRDTRYMIRKSEKAGLEWTEEITLDQFYELYAHTVHRLGTPVFSKQLFQCLRSEFKDKCRLFGVRKSNRYIAGVLCFYFRDVVIPYYSGSLVEFHKDCPNNFMYWNLMVQSFREGYRVFDFGRSKKGTGAYAFKSSWGMKVSELPYRYQLNGNNKVPMMSPVDPKFQRPVSAWKKLPFSLTKVIGPHLVKALPSI